MNLQPVPVRQPPAIVLLLVVFSVLLSAAPLFGSIADPGLTTAAADRAPSAGHRSGGGSEGQVAAAVSDLEIIRERVVRELLAAEVDERRVTHLVASLQPDGTWPDIDYQDVSRTGFEHRTHVTNTAEMSRAYGQQRSRWYRKPELKRAISAALDFWIRHDFVGENWHSNEIANPVQWTRILLMMDSELTEDQTRELVRMAGRANLHAWGARPGGDLIKIAGIIAKRALFERDTVALRIATRAMAAEIDFTTGRGLKPDFSFNHRADRVTSILSYGVGYAAAFTDWAVRLVDTRYAFPGTTIELLIDFYLDGISRSMVHGRYPDPGAINREMSRQGALAPVGPDLPRNLLRVSSYRKADLERLVRLRTGEKVSPPSANRFFWHVEYLSHQRAEYFASVRMHSARNHSMEYPHNLESLKHHHYADGATFISRSGDEYRDIFPVWDWQKIPGTTVVQKPSLPGPEEIVKPGRTEFVGAVSDGTYGAAVFDFQSPHDPLSARKSWFFFDREFVALGAEITSDADHSVATTLNQSRLRGEVVVAAGPGASVLQQGKHDLKGVTWVIHDRTAYLFPRPARVHLENRIRSGAWREITHQSWARELEEDVRQEVFTLWLDHGRRPRGATYEYVVVPGMRREEIESYRAAPGVRVLANSSRVQGVWHEGMSLSQVVFYEAGTIELADGVRLTAASSAAVIVEGSGVAIRRITVADPTRQLGSLRLELSARVQGGGDGWSVSWKEPDRRSEIQVQLPRGAHAGRSVVLEMMLPLHTCAGPAATRLVAPSSPGAGGERALGERAEGGVVFWVDERGSGLVAAVDDQSAGMPWSGGERPNRMYGTGDGLGAGERNTLLIGDARSGDDPTSFAASTCLAYRGGGFGDWYLPSKAELELMYRRRSEIGGFANASYWSSTEYNIGFAWEQYFHGYGGQYTNTKGSPRRVRCVRRF